jgi:hypothetical protein
MEFFAFFIYQFPFILAQPMPPSINGCLICKVYRELHGFTPTYVFIENANTFSYLISKYVTQFLSFLVSWFPITKG